PSRQRNYKGFSYKDYLKTKQTYGIIQVENEDNIKIIKKQNINFISLQINRLSVKLKSNLKQILPEQYYGLAKGILLGDSSDIEQELKDNFKACNLSHILAVSGVHISYLIIGIRIILNKKTLGNRKSKIATILMILVFMMITNMTPSVVRAGISVIIGIVATLIYRKPDTYTTIGIAILLTLIQNPFSIFNVGMQLSYVGTIGILLFQQIIKNNLLKFQTDITNKIIKKYEEINCNKRIQRGKKSNDNSKNIEEKNLIKLSLGKIKTYLIESISVTLSANILIFPLTLYHFNTIPLNFIISNLTVGPMLGITIILGLLVLVVSIISIQFAKNIVIPLKAILSIIIKTTEIIAKIPMGNLTVITPKISSIILIYIFLAKIFISTKKEEENYISRLYLKYLSMINTKTLAILIAIIIITTNLLGNINIEKSLKLYFIDVGQGDSSLICTPSGKKILIDGGGTRNPEQYDVGEQVLLPYLLDRRISYLDYIMISHFDADHSQGLEAVLENIKVKNIIISKQASICAEYEKIMELCKEKKINIIVVRRGGKIQIDKYVFFEILHPGDKMLDDGKGGLNANAIVARLYFELSNSKYSIAQNQNIRETDKKYFTILFTGDIEANAEAELVKIYGNELKSDILKVGHHRFKNF
ncbi:MAG: ComEC/Rec2 family competence protein, partial [Clostridia bacterium]